MEMSGPQVLKQKPSPLLAGGRDKGGGFFGSTQSFQIDPHPLPLPPMNKGKGSFKKRGRIIGAGGDDVV
jgi:hypothetical protein